MLLGIVISLILVIAGLSIVIIQLRRMILVLMGTISDSEKTLVGYNEALANTEYFLKKTNASIALVRKHDDYLGMLNRKYRAMHKKAMEEKHVAEIEDTIDMPEELDLRTFGDLANEAQDKAQRELSLEAMNGYIKGLKDTEITLNGEIENTSNETVEQYFARLNKNFDGTEPVAQVNKDSLPKIKDVFKYGEPITFNNNTSGE